jgi:hypothetical protein
LRSQNAGQTGLNRLRQAKFSAFIRPTFAGQVNETATRREPDRKTGEQEKLFNGPKGRLGGILDH